MTTAEQRVSVAVDPARRLIRFRFGPQATVGDWKEAQAVFLRLSEETAIRRALVDIREQGDAGPKLELFEFGSNIPSGMVFAVLSDRGRDDHQFVETVALNRGKSVRLFFGAEEEALAWLAAKGGGTAP